MGAVRIALSYRGEIVEGNGLVHRAPLLSHR